MPVRNVDWAAQVTAGRTVPSGALGAGLGERLEVGHVVEETGGEADDVEDEERVWGLRGAVGVRPALRRARGCSWQLLQAEVRQQVAGEGEFGGDAVGELGAGTGAQLGREGLPGVGLDLQMAGERVRAADEPGQRGLEDGECGGEGRGGGRVQGDVEVGAPG